MHAGLTILTAAAAAGSGHDAGHGEGGVDWLLVGSLFGNVILFFGFLIWMISPAISKGLAARRANMAVDLEKAQKKQAEAETRLAEYNEKLQNLEREVEKVVDGFKKEADADRAKIEAEADRAIERLNRETEFTIQQETIKAERQIRAAAVDATLTAAEQKIKSRIEASDHARLTDQYVEGLGQSNGSIS